MRRCVSFCYFIPAAILSLFAELVMIQRTRIGFRMLASSAAMLASVSTDERGNAHTIRGVCRKKVVVERLLKTGFGQIELAVGA
jgi:hypothetical protein